MSQKAPPPPQKDDGSVVTLDFAARLLKVTAERIRQLQREGYIAKHSPGKVLLVSAIQGYIQFLKDAASKTTKTAADSRVRDARAKEIEMRNAVRLRELIPIEDAAAALDHLVGVVRERMNSIPARVTRDLELRRKIEAEVNAAQAKIAEALAASADVIAKGGDLPFSGSDK